jgi:hypothetical protein
VCVMMHIMCEFDLMEPVPNIPLGPEHACWFTIKFKLLYPSLPAYVIYALSVTLDLIARTCYELTLIRSHMLTHPHNTPLHSTPHLTSLALTLANASTCSCPPILPCLTLPTQHFDILAPIPHSVL